MNNKKIVTLSIIGLIIFVVGGIFVLSSKKEAPEAVVSEPATPVEEIVDTLSPEDLGFNLTLTSDNRKVIMEIDNVEDILSLDYELSYTVKGDIPRGVIGHIDIKSKAKPVKQEVVLGTCSDVCHYDQDISDIKMVLKVQKLDNRVYSVEKSLDI